MFFVVGSPYFIPTDSGEEPHTIPATVDIQLDIIGEVKITVIFDDFAKILEEGLVEEGLIVGIEDIKIEFSLGCLLIKPILDIEISVLDGAKVLGEFEDERIDAVLGEVHHKLLLKNEDELVVWDLNAGMMIQIII